MWKRSDWSYLLALFFIVMAGIQGLRGNDNIEIVLYGIFWMLLSIYKQREDS